jgi:hypothetical protein
VSTVPQETSWQAVGYRIAVPPISMSMAIS